MFVVLARLIGVHRIPRQGGVSDRTVVLSMGGRFFDELLSGVLIIAMPAIRSRLGLTVAQVGMCFQLLSAAAAVVEPAVGATIDLTSRRPLLLWGAVGTAATGLLAAGSGSFAWLAAAFLVYGTASGPLVLTSDVVLIQVHPGGEERISARGDLVDTIGALLAPAAIAGAAWAGLDERAVLTAVGVLGILYASALWRAVLPPPPDRTPSVAARHASLSVQLRGTVSGALASAPIRRWLAALIAIEALSVSELFVPLWLHDEVGMSHGLVAVHVGIDLGTGLVALALLDRLIERVDPVRVLRVAAIASLVTGTLWLLVGGPMAKLVLAVPHAIAVAPLWPIARARALSADPSRAGTVAGLLSLAGLLPLAALIGWVGQVVGLGPAMLAVHLVGGVLLLAVVRTDPEPVPRQEADTAS